MTNNPYIKLETLPGSNVEDTIRKACGIATTLAVDVRYQLGKERFHVQPGVDPEEAINAYNESLPKGS